MSNLLVSVMVAKTSSPAEFGAFGVGYVIFILIVGCSRALSGDVLLVAERERDERSQAIGVPLLLCGSVLLITAVASIAVRGIGDAVSWLCIVGIFVVAEDYGRYWANAVGRSALATTADVGSLLVQAAIYFLLIVLDVRQGFLYVACWGISSVFGIVILSQAGFWERRSYRLEPLKSWLAEHGTLGSSFLGDFILLNASSVLAQVVLVSAHGSAAAAGVRGSQLLFGPITVVTSGLSLFVLPEMSRPHVTDRNRLRLLIGVSLLLGFMSFFWTAGLLLAPRGLGVWLTGPSWQLVEPLLILAGLYSVGGGVATGAIWGIRSLRKGRILLRVRLLVAPSIAAVTCAGAVLAAERGLMFGLACSTIASAAIWWFVYIRLVRAR